jgi:hypothetical protein
MASPKTRQRLANEPWRKLYGTKRWKQARRHALIRACHTCGRCGGNRSLDVHHIIALKDGGAAYDPNNLQVLCRPCHRTADKADLGFFEQPPSTSRPVAIPLPDARKSAEEPAEEPEKPHECWLSPDGRRWSRDWGGGTLIIVDGEPVEVR